MSGNRKRGLVLQPRDRQLLTELAVLKVIDREQAQLIAGFHSVTRANTRLLRLSRAGFLSRIFTGTIEGGRKCMYLLTQKGAAAVGVSAPVVKLKREALTSGSPSLDHQQLINAVLLVLKYQPIPHHAVTLHRSIAFREQLSASLPLIPDGYCELATPVGIRAMFLEVDLGTEPLRVWTAKVKLYLQLAISGEFAKRFRAEQFRVLVLTSSERRLQYLRRTTAKLTDKIFWFATFESINREGFWAPIWLRPVGDQRLPLL
jgi:hypothetical protein